MITKKKKINILDLFAGCGGLIDGFEKNGGYQTLACVEWERSPCENLEKRLKEKWGYKDADKRVIRFDIQRTEELFYGWNDKEYGTNNGLDDLIGEKQVDLVIGGPPCQSYSYAGRIRDENGMRDDYRNYLFEKYLEVVKRYQPKFFIFENVPGILSAAPDGELITNKIKRGFENIGYFIPKDLKEAVIDMSEYAIPQNRKRVIIFGVNSNCFKENSNKLINIFYKELESLKTEKKSTVSDAISDLPKLYPLTKPYKYNGRRLSHSVNHDGSVVKNHLPRFHNERDVKIFNLLANDIESGTNKYQHADELKKLYTKMTGRTSNVHKYYVLRWDKQSNTIPAHLYKDGLRHIHPDSKQARSITVREAARLQTFDDDYEFIGSMMNQYKMIGNAVPPKFSKILADIIEKIFQQV